MALLHEAVDEKKFDVRVVEKNVTKGVISQDDFKKAVNQLVDDEANAMWVSIDDIASETEAPLSNGLQGGVH